MCLYINKLKHWRLFRRGLVPIKLKKNLEVYKVLVTDVVDYDPNYAVSFCLNANLAETPYQHTKVEFMDDLKYMPKIEPELFSNYSIIRLGDHSNHVKYQPKKDGDAYHSYTTIEAAQKCVDELYNYCMRRQCFMVEGKLYRPMPLVYKAVIPAGSYVFYGYKEAAEIASNEILIVNQTLGQPKKFCNKIEKAENLCAKDI